MIAAPRHYAEVVGDPIAQSKSPVMHGFWLDALAINADYRATRAGPDDLARFFKDRRDDPEWAGCNITSPDKIAALDHVEDRGGLRASVGAINTVVRADDGILVGTNTDIAGFYAPLAGLDLAGQAVTVIGSGGAARAVLYALARLDVGPVTLLVRSPLKGAALLATFGLKGQALPLGPAAPANCGLLINASSLGMIGQPDFAIDLAPMTEGSWVYDLVTAPVETMLLAAARARRLETIDGLEMLVGQGAVAFELFFGVAPPRERDDELRTLLLN